MQLPAGQDTRVNTPGWAAHANCRTAGGATLPTTCRSLHAPAAWGPWGWGLPSGLPGAGLSGGGARGDWARERGLSRS